MSQTIGRCYCGACAIASNAKPLVVTFCHCQDCKRWTGAAAPVFAGFDHKTLQISGAEDGTRFDSGAHRWMCPKCGSPLGATFPYLPDQIYVPVGVLNDAADLQPSLHCHAGQALHWATPDDGLPHSDGTGRDVLNKASQ